MRGEYQEAKNHLSDDNVQKTHVTSDDSDRFTAADIEQTKSVNVSQDHVDVSAECVEELKIPITDPMVKPSEKKPKTEKKPAPRKTAQKRNIKK